MSKKEMSPSSQLAFDMAKIFLDIETKSFKSGMKHAKEDAERERKMQAFADKCERDLKTNEPIDLDKPIAIHCKTHGLFYVRARDHIGENEEQVAYGCYRCGDKKELEREA